MVGAKGCISFDSYIKPQLVSFSNYIYFVVYLLIPTSNHNRIVTVDTTFVVVYLLIPTSNHNFRLLYALLVELYIF